VVKRWVNATGKKEWREFDINVIKGYADVKGLDEHQSAIRDALNGTKVDGRTEEISLIA